MRVSTGMIFQQGLDSLQRQQSQLLDTQQHIAANKRVMSPSDDPVAAARAVETSQAKALNAQYGANQANARDTLSQVEATLGDLGTLMQDVRTLYVAAGDGALSAKDRESLAIDLEAKLAQMLGLANTRDGAGAYLFGGFQENVQPFTQTATGAVYNGDQGHRELQVGPGRSIPISENGAELFQRIRQGNGTFVTASDAVNAGTGLINIGRAVGNTAVPVDTYRIDFTVTAGVTTYDVVNVTTSTTLSTGNAYTPGATIAFNNLQLEISGDPANGDSFDIAPAANQSVFGMISDAIATLRLPAVNPADRTRYDEGMQRAIANMDQALDRTITVRTGVGSSLRELDTLDSVTQDNALNYDKRLSELVDLDYAQALTDFAKQQTALEAAQLSFQRITSLSLFDYL
ncbi:MAG TPA: flagellar hook-associated protein FlgL [Burkholderiales bacterium]|nr:flagellar hook-associated protein FlgL [Burkholderiales bacterium]